MRVHATVVAIGGRGVMLMGPSGSGKSDLALRLIDRGALLVGDDYVDLFVEQGRLFAREVGIVVGQIEIREVGIVPVASTPQAPVSLIVDLSRPGDRLPEPETREFLGVATYCAHFAPFTASAAIKVEQALKRHGLPLEAAPR